MARLVQAGMDFATEGERRVAGELSLLPEEWVIIANKILTTQNGRSFETDFIVIADRHIFLIDEKGWRGRITGSETIWVRNDGESVNSPLNKVDYVAKILAGSLRDRVSGFSSLKGLPVQGCVLLSQSDQRPAVKDPRARIGVVLIADAVESLVARDNSGGDPGVAELRRRIERALVDLSNRPKVPAAIGSYKVIESLPMRTEARRFRARHPEGGERFLTVYGPLEKDSNLHDFYLQEYRALRELSGLGVAPACLDFFEWSDNFLVIPNELPKGSSLSSLPLPTDESSAQQELRRATAAFNSLAKIHDTNVLHRALGPETIFVSESDDGVHVEFTDFFAARRGNQTIAQQLDEYMEDDPYAAPEIRSMNSYSWASESSDTYTLALVFLERISGVTISNLVDEHLLASVPDSESAWPYFPQEIAERISATFTSALTPGPMAPARSSEEARTSASEIAAELEAISHSWTVDNRIEHGELLDGRYRVERILGEGVSARTFLATDTHADEQFNLQFALKQLRRPHNPSVWNDTRREFTILMSHPHQNLPRVHHVKDPSDDVHIILEYVEGVRLTDALSVYLFDIEKCRQLANALLSVIGHLEHHGLLHRDIKPDNIIFDPDSGKTVLIDFGSAVAAGPTNEAAGTPGYAPPEAFFGNPGDGPPSSTDRYAVAVVLFQALTGQLPFTDGTIEQTPITDLSWIPEPARRFAQVLLRGIDPDPEQRYPSASEMNDALLAAELTIGSGSDEEETLEEVVNPWVDEIRRLYRNSRLGNSENRGLDTNFARETYVQTALDTDLLPSIFERVPRAVFLTGNPGDGKTAFLAQVEQALIDRGAERRRKDDSGWNYVLDEHMFRACYDASEAHNGKSADEQLQKKLNGLQGDERPAKKLTVLVAINDGRLAEIVHGYSDFQWLTDGIEETIANPESQTFESRGVWMVDLKKRSYVSLLPGEGDESVMRRMLATLAAPEHWSACKGCVARATCPIHQNALALGNEDDAETRARLEYALLLSHLRNERHITVRDLRSGLAYLITSDTGCEEIHHSRQHERLLPATHYWDTAFSTVDGQDLLLGQLVSIDPARRPQPQLERLLFYHQDRASSEVRQSLVRDSHDLPHNGHDRGWLAQWKRRLYFQAHDGVPLRASDSGDDGAKLYWQHLLPYDYADNFLQALDEEHFRQLLLEDICHGISRSDGLAIDLLEVGIDGGSLQEGLALTVADSEKERLTVCKHFPLRDFRLIVQTTVGMNMIETIPHALVLEHMPTGQELLISLDLFEILMRFKNGLEPRSPELQPLLEDMEPFKNAIQMTESIDLYLIENGERVHLLTQEDGKVVLKQPQS